MIKLSPELVPPGRRDGVVPDELREHYRVLLQRLGWPGGGPPDTPRALGVTSCRRGEGVSTVAACLAATAAASGQGPVLLVDADLARPAAHSLLGVSPAPGLSEALADRSVPPVVQPSPVAG